MTSRTRLTFTEDSQQDIDDIQQYTLERWGRGQMERYQSVLYDAFEWRRSYPESGHEREAGIRELVLRHHVVLYRYDGETVFILRVMHPRRLRR